MVAKAEQISQFSSTTRIETTSTMTQKLVLATVLLVFVLTEKVFLTSCQQYDSDNNSPKTPSDTSDSPQLVYVINTVGEEESQDSTTMIPSTTELSVDSTTQPMESTVAPVVGTIDGTIGQRNNNWLNSVFGRTVNGPSLVVEVNDATNEASLKILNLPLIRLTKTATTATTGTTETIATISESAAKSRRKRDIDFKIHDKTVIRATLDALKRIGDERVDILEANINRVEIKAEIIDYEDLEHDRKRRDIEFQIHDMSVVKTLIKALKRSDPQGADYLESNIQHLEISIEIDD